MKVYKCGVVNKDTIITVDWEYVQCNEGVYIPQGYDEVRIIGLTRNATLYYCDGILMGAAENVWKEKQFRRVDNAVVYFEIKEC